MNYTAALEYWRKELSDPTATGHNWTPDEIAEQAIHQLVYCELIDFIEADPAKLDELLLTDTDGMAIDRYVNAFVDRSE